MRDFPVDDQALVQRAHYDRIAENYVGSRESSAAYQTFLPVWCQRLLEPWIDGTSATERMHQVVVDPMCGHGNLARFLLEQSQHVILNDLSPEMVERIDADLRPRCRILPPSDARSLPLDAASADVIVVSGGLHHVYRHLAELLLEFRRILKPNGWLLFGEPSNDFMPVRVLRNTIYRLSSKFDQDHEQGFRHRVLRESLESAGFASVRIRPFGSIGYLLMAQVGVIPLLKRIHSPRLFRFLIGFDGVVEKTPLLNRSCFALTGVARAGA